MLILSRKRLESIRISDNIVVTILGIQRNKVSIGIDAPKEIPVLRTELQNQTFESPRHTASERTTSNTRVELKEEVQSYN